MCSFMMISHRGDVTDSNLPRAHRTRASMRAGIRARAPGLDFWIPSKNRNRARNACAAVRGTGFLDLVQKSKSQHRYTATWAYVHWMKYEFAGFKQTS